MSLNREDAEAIALTAARVTAELWEAQRKKANERVYGFKSIAAELGVSERQLRYLVKTKRFPLDRDHLGYSVARWELTRWLESSRRPVHDEE